MNVQKFSPIPVKKLLNVLLISIGNNIDHRNELIIKKLKLPEAYKVTFLEQSHKTKLDISENFWITKLKAKINISRTVLPFYK